MTDLDCTVIGGGVVGCAVAAELSGRGLSTVLLEMEDGLGRATTSRNSEVVARRHVLPDRFAQGPLLRRRAAGC